MEWNGFYDISKLDIYLLKELYKDAYKLASSIQLDYLPINKGWSRKNYYGKTIKETMKLLSLTTHNTCINRKVYDSNREFEREGEISFATMSGESIYLWFYLSEKNFNKLVERYHLQKKLI